MSRFVNIIYYDNIPMFFLLLLARACNIITEACALFIWYIFIGMVVVNAMTMSGRCIYYMGYDVENSTIASITQHSIRVRERKNPDP